jgi:hypothetical protein
VRLNSLDAYGMSVQGMGRHVPSLEVDEQQEIPFQVQASSTANLYATIDGWMGDRPSHWESLPITVRVGDQVAELADVYARTRTGSYPSDGDIIYYQATVRGFIRGEGLALELWMNTPSGEFQELAKLDLEPLVAGEAKSFTGEIALQEEGAHTLYAYLYEHGKRIGRKTDLFYVT